MSVISILFRNEMIKMLKRLAFWVTLGFFSFIMVMQHGQNYSRAAGDPSRPFALPDAWRQIVTGDSEIVLIFGSVILLLLMSNEFSWRTARQNVIDGLSKEQFFLGKVLLLPAVGLILIIAQLLIGGSFALAGTDLGTSTEPLIRMVHWSTLGGVLFAFIGYGSLALLISMTVRSSGPAIAVWFFYVAVGEQLLQGILGQVSDRLGAWAAFFPINTFNQLHQYYQYDGAAFERAVESALEAGQQAPAEPWSWSVLLLVSAAWITVFLASSFMWFTKRDL